jgi:hypothetical protein
MLPHEDPSQTPGFPTWVRLVALLVIVALVGFFALSAF